MSETFALLAMLALLSTFDSLLVQPSLPSGRRCGCQQNLRRLRMCDGADDAVPDTLDMSLLAKRFQEVRDAEVDRRTESLLTAAKNWRTGRCEQRTVCVLDELSLIHI